MSELSVLLVYFLCDVSQAPVMPSHEVAFECHTQQTFVATNIYSQISYVVQDCGFKCLLIIAFFPRQKISPEICILLKKNLY